MKQLTHNKLLLALKGKNKGRPPIWLMRQAGRYMPEYRSIRSRHSFLQMCHQPELIAEVTQLPIRAFGMDAAILFSDILLLAEAFNLGLSFDDGKGPLIAKPLNTEMDVEHLPAIDVEEKLGFVASGIKLIQRQLTVPLIGFCGGPFTLASYMIEGGSSHDLLKTKQWMLKHPVSFHQLLEKIAKASGEYLDMQVRAGVDAIQIFDSWANYLSWGHFLEFSYFYMKKLVQEVRKHQIPVILYCRGSSVFAPQLAKAGSQAISLDWNCDMASIRKQIPDITLQGNLDPDILLAPTYKIEQEAKQLLNTMQNDPAFIFNLGHGIKPNTPYDSVKVLVELVKS